VLATEPERAAIERVHVNLSAGVIDVERALPGGRAGLRSRPQGRVPAARDRPRRGAGRPGSHVAGRPAAGGAAM